MLLYEAYELIIEAGISTIRRNKSSKRNAFAGKSAINICKIENPGLYKRYKKVKDLHMKLKVQINTKYKARSMAISRKKIR